MITGVADVYYAVQDKKRAVVFNRNVLNLAVTEEIDHWSAMNVGDPASGLIRRTASRPRSARS